MQAAQFETAVENIRRRDHRFEPHAYFFLKDSLDFTLNRAKESNNGQPRHVTGQELLMGYRDLALQEFGPMAATLMSEWGLKNTRHIGEIVFQLIEEQMFGRQDQDTIEDFEDVYDFEEAFIHPYLPSRKVESRQG